jgi:hypothetical protein
MHIDVDPRLAAAAGGAARYLVEAAGLDSETSSQWQTAVITACKEAFARPIGEHPHVDVEIARLADRVEVALTHASGITRLTKQIAKSSVQ